MTFTKMRQNLVTNSTDRAITGRNTSRTTLTGQKSVFRIFVEWFFEKKSCIGKIR